MDLSLNSFADQFVFWNLKKISYGYLELTDSKGINYSFGNKDSYLKARIKINNPDFTSKLLRKGSTGLGEGYINNDFQTDDLPALIELSARNINVTYKFSGLLNTPFIQSIFNKLIFTNTRERSKKNISAHYDLGNEFFSTWLDKSLTYSCGIFNSFDETLERAQINKYNKLINLIKPKPGSRILEIGCGWGGFAEQLAKNYDIKLDCITISKKQYEYTKAKMNRIGLNDKVNIKMIDYRDVKNKYENIVSIEMIEAVGEKYLLDYFKSIKENLAPGGRAAIQSIVINDGLYDRYRTKEDFIQKFIFPGGFLPSLKSLKKLTSSSGLLLDSPKMYGEHYSNTLQKWRKSFLTSWEQISRQGFNLNFKNMWDFYLSYCEAGFKSKNIDLLQFSLCNK
jgi:cyclopropane-fatty-acyl-phospholipid synthase